MRLAILDLETTGLDPQRDEIIEIGLVICDSKDFTIYDQWDIKIKPERPEDGHPEAYKVNGYCEEDWKDGVTLHQALVLLSERTEKATMLSYNVSFDYGFLQAAYKKTGLRDPMNYHRLDLLTLAWSKIPHDKMQSWALKTVCSYLRIQPEPKIHRGANGAMKAYEVYRRLTETII